MMNKDQVTDNFLTKLRAQLPTGAQRQAADITGYSYGYTRQVLSGMVSPNMEIIAACQRIIREHREGDYDVLKVQS